MKRPPKKALDSFRPWMLGDDTVGRYLKEGWSLGICCRSCDRPPVVWTPPELAEKFGHLPALKLVTLQNRLSCLGPDGCGSKDVAVYQLDYAEPWTWPKSQDQP